MSTVTSAKLKPLADKVVVKILDSEEKTKGGIFLPDTAKEKPQQAKVIAVGPGKTLDDGKKSPLDVKEGDIVLFAKYSGTEVKIDGVEYLVISEKDILAVVEA
ncbi:MAG: co-chaperone GroES [Candidatus Sericytochromatia bacterium]|nr:co-chaperone GroES [Candidatus Sericytochromatia bacterium]